MDDNEARYPVSGFENRFDTKPKRQDVSWEKWVQVLSRRDVRAEKDGKLFSPAAYAPLGRRSNEAVECLSMLVIDLDGCGFREVEAAFASRDLACVAYTTHSHTEDKPRWRVVAPLDRRVSPDGWREWYEATCTMLVGGYWDRSCSDPARMHYLPSCPESRKSLAQTVVLAGDPIEADLTPYRILPPESEIRETASSIDRLLRGHVPDGEKHNTLRSAVRAMRGRGYAIEAARLVVDQVLRRWESEGRLERPFAAERKSWDRDLDKVWAKFSPDEPDEEERPSVCCNGQELYLALTEVRQGVESVKDQATLFVSSGRVVSVVETDEGGVRLEEAGGAAAAAELSRLVRFYKVSSKGDVSNCYPPKELVAAWLESPDHGDLRRISMVCPGPTMRRDGTFATAPGYDDASCWFLSAGYGRFDFLTGESPAESIEWLDRELFGDFGFVDAASRANAFALMFLPFVRALVDGPTPMHLVQAPTQGSGKGKLLQACLMPYFGREVSLTPVPRDEDEMRKKIATALFSGARVVAFDNVVRKFESESLDAALTSSVYEDRKLGSSSALAAKNLAVWCATLNNPTLSTDLARRSCTIVIDPNVERPWERTSFRHPHLERWIKDNLFAIRQRVLNVLAGWSAVGMTHGSSIPIGSFESYAHVLGGILASCGVEGFLANHSQAFDAMAEESAAWGHLLERLSETCGHRFSTSDVWNELTEEGHRHEVVKSILGDGSDGSIKRRLGWKLKQIEGRVLGGFRLVRLGMFAGAMTYRVAEVENGEKPTKKPTNAFEPGNGPHGGFLGDGSEETHQGGRLENGPLVGFGGFQSLPRVSKIQNNTYKDAYTHVGNGETNPPKPTTHQEPASGQPADPEQDLTDPFSAASIAADEEGVDLDDI